MSADCIYVIHSNAKIETLYTLFPLVVSKYSHLFRFLHKDSKEAKSVQGRCVVLVRVFKGNEAFADAVQKRRDLIADYKKRFDRVVMLDDGAGSDSLHFEYMDMVDLYFKGKLLSNRNDYLQPRYGRQIFTDYYHRKFGLSDEKVKWRNVPENPEVIKKLRVSWNLACGIYPLPGGFINKLAAGMARFNMLKGLRPYFTYSLKRMLNHLGSPPDLGSKMRLVQARFSYKAFPNTVGFQRKLLMEKCSGNPNMLSGKISLKQYNREIKSVAAVLSPFGWGEICFRDFEAIYNGSILIKPSVEHLETWPDLYHAGATYLAVDWNGEQVQDVIRGVANNPVHYRRLVTNATEAYRNSLLQIDERVFTFYKEALGELREPFAVRLPVGAALHR